MEQAKWFIMSYRHIILILGGLTVMWTEQLLMLFWIGLGLVLTTGLARWLLPWPTDLVGFEAVNLFKIWQGVLVLTFLTRERGNWLHGAAGMIVQVAILSGAAFRYGDRGAAILENVKIDIVELISTS